jgi:hypothetical protein
MITFRFQSGCPAGSGSGSVTSRPAAATWPRSSAETSASVSTTPPRETLTRIVPRFIIPNSFGPIIPLESGVSGTALATTSARGRRRWKSSGPPSSSTKSGFSSTLGSVARTRMPKPKARRAIPLPIPPRPMTSMVFPWSSSKATSGGCRQAPSGGLRMKCVKPRVKASR